jgi:hypothetical protein
VPSPPFNRSIIAVAAMQMLPPSIRESLLSDPIFLDNYELTATTRISIGGKGMSVQASKLYNCIRGALADRSTRPTLKDEMGKEWQLEVIEIDNRHGIGLTDGTQRLLLPDHSALFPDQAERLNAFDYSANEVNLPEKAISAWRTILASRALADEEIDVLHLEIKETPVQVAALINSEMENGEVSVSTLVPRSERYFNRLVGEFPQAQNIVDHVQVGVSEHVHQLMSWRAYDGFLLSLLLSSHSSISSAIDADRLEEKDIIRAYEWLLKAGDRISQIGAIEVGLSILDKWPKIEPYLQALIEQIRDDNADQLGRLHLLSALIVFVEGEMARTKLFREKPVFWRRLAAIAQASLIERCVIKSQIDRAQFAQWVWQARVQFFYLQSLVDLRREPRWFPDYVSAQQLKAEFIGRILGAAYQNATKIQSPALQALLFGEEPESLKSLVEFPYPYLPGPLEGGIESRHELPPEMLKTIEAQLSEDILRPHSFVALLNSVLVFRIDSQQAALAAKALRAKRHQLRQADTKEQLLIVLRRLATVAAVTRSRELAEELRILARRWRYEEGRGLSAEETMKVGLVAAAAHLEMTDWCDFLGEWITELAFQPSEPDEMEQLYSDVKHLCHIVPELWLTCGRAEAALSVSVST